MSKLMAYFFGMLSMLLVFILYMIIIVATPKYKAVSIVSVGDRVFIESESKFGTVIGFKKGKLPIIKIDTDRIFITEAPEKK